MPTSIQILTAEHDAEDARQAYLASPAHIAALEAAITSIEAVPSDIRSADAQLKLEILRRQLIHAQAMRLR